MRLEFAPVSNVRNLQRASRRLSGTMFQTLGESSLDSPNPNPEARDEHRSSRIRLEEV